jgi:hypothetical protein
MGDLTRVGGRHMPVKELRSERVSIREITRVTSHARDTVHKVLRGEHTLNVTASALAVLLNLRSAQTPLQHRPRASPTGQLGESYRVY